MIEILGRHRVQTAESQHPGTGYQGIDRTGFSVDFRHCAGYRGRIADIARNRMEAVAGKSCGGVSKGSVADVEAEDLPATIEQMTGRLQSNTGRCTGNNRGVGHRKAPFLFMRTVRGSPRSVATQI